MSKRATAFDQQVDDMKTSFVEGMDRLKEAQKNSMNRFVSEHEAGLDHMNA